MFTDSPSRMILLVGMAVIMTAVYVAFIYYFLRRRRYPHTNIFKFFPKLLPVIVAIFATMISLSIYIIPSRDLKTEGSWAPTSTKERIQFLEQDISKIQDELMQLKSKFSTITETNNVVLTTSNQNVADLAVRISESEKAIKKFEGLFISDAEKLVTLPLLQRDFQAVTEDLKSVKSAVGDLRSLLTEINNQNRWVIGTLALGILALVLPAVKSLLAPTTREGQSKGQQSH